MAVRKIVRMRRTALVLKKIMLADLIFAVVGLALYMTVLPYDVVVIDAFLWVLEALMSTGVVATLNVITSRTLYGARYEVLRDESVASLLIALATMVMSAHLLADEVSKVLSNYTPQSIAPTKYSIHIRGCRSISSYLAPHEATKWEYYQVTHC